MWKRTHRASRARKEPPPTVQIDRAESEEVTSMKRTRKRGGEMRTAPQDDLPPPNKKTKSERCETTEYYDHGYNTRSTRKPPTFVVEIKQGKQMHSPKDGPVIQTNRKARFVKAEPVLESIGHKESELEHQVEDLQNQLKASRSKHRSEMKDKENLRQRLADCQRNLAACKDDLFRLQPLSQISDSEIVNEFEAINDNIIKWVDARIDTVEEVSPHISDVELFQTDPKSTAAEFMQQFPNVGDFYTRSLIHRHLIDLIFLKSFNLFGLSRNETILLKKIGNSMRELQPKRGTLFPSSLWINLMCFRSSDNSPVGE